MELVPLSFSPEQLASAAAVGDLNGLGALADSGSTENSRRDGEEGIDPYDLIEVLGSLIRVKTEFRLTVKTIELAHYTVKEYLYSDRIKHGPANFFRMSSSQTSELVTFVLLQCCLQIAPEENQPFAPFAVTAFKNWRRLFKAADVVVAGNKDLLALLFQLLDPREEHYVFHMGRSPCAFKLSLYEPRSPSCSFDTVILLNLIRLGLYSATAAFLLQHSTEDIERMFSWRERPFPEQSLLDYLAELGHSSYLSLVAKRGVKVDEAREDAPRTSTLLWALQLVKLPETITMLRVLIEAKAVVNPEGTGVTPLQVAIAELKPAVVELLVQAGANVNAVGEPNGWLPPFLKWVEGSRSPLAILRRARRRFRKLEYKKAAVKQIEETLVDAGAREFEHYELEIEAPASLAIREYEQESEDRRRKEYTEKEMNFGPVLLQRIDEKREEEGRRP